jgi:hypothetical protein
MFMQCGAALRHQRRSDRGHSLSLDKKSAMKIKAIIPAVVIVSTLAAPAFAQPNGPVLQGSQMNANGAPVSQAAPTPHSLTHRDVYNQLVQAEKDGSHSRIKATFYSGS